MAGTRLTASASGREKPGSKLRPLSTSRLFPKRQKAGAVKDLADIPLLVDLGKAWESGETPLLLYVTALLRAKGIAVSWG